MKLYDWLQTTPFTANKKATANGDEKANGITS